jgi:hypothetical protein
VVAFAAGSESRHVDAASEEKRRLIDETGREQDAIFAADRHEYGTGSCLARPSSVSELDRWMEVAWCHPGFFHSQLFQEQKWQRSGGTNSFALDNTST